MSVFDWCKPQVSDHKNCIQSFEKFYVDPKTNRVVLLGEDVVCECSKRGCPCFVPAAKRSPKRKRK